MRKESTWSTAESRVNWEHLEEWVRGQVQRLVQEMLGYEVTEFLGRVRSARRSSLDDVPGYRNEQEFDELSACFPISLNGAFAEVFGSESTEEKVRKQLMLCG